ncbi:unnamed protein product [Spodoptera exigua]|nr:unnamed protein product [Spodoptera exigua]
MGRLDRINTTASQNTGVGSPSQVMDDTKFHRSYPNIVPASSINKELVDIMLKRMDPDLDGVINFQDFHDSVMKTPSLLESLGYCLPERPAVYAFIATWCPRWARM